MYLCVCNAVTYDEFRSIALTGTATDAEIITGAGSCCGQCIDDIDELHEKILEEKKKPNPPPQLTLDIM